MYKVIYGEDAERHEVEAIEWYQAINPNLAVRFIEELEETIGKYIAKSPTQWRTYIGNTRKLSMKEFPYKVIYTVNEEKKVVQILGIWHHKRREWGS